MRFVILLLGGHRHVALENVALRQQSAVFRRDNKRPRLNRRDRLFWIGLRAIWKNWKSALIIVRPETVISWQRKDSSDIGGDCLNQMDQDVRQ
jgi:hypothetical protein